MGEIEVNTAYGWVKLTDIIHGRENCDKCGAEGRADAAGYQSLEAELIIWYCLECRS